MKRESQGRTWAWLIVVFILTGLHAPAFGAPQIPGFYGSPVPNLTPPAANALPTLLPGGVLKGATIPGASDNKLEIFQNQPWAIIDWKSFDIGQDAWTHFNQQGNKDWTALNRIWDKNPSQIFGRLTADGRVFLINQNGILFGPSSKVNVHSLIASALNMTNSDFLNGALKFKAGEYDPTTDTIDTSKANLAAVVANHGVIETDELGSVFLLAPTVENSGVMLVPLGQAGLAAGAEAELYKDPDPNSTRAGLFVHVMNTPGTATNFENGWVIADAGLAGMYGKVVNQDGLIRAITAVKKNGEIELYASDKVSTGAQSITSVEVSDSPEKVNKSFTFIPGEIRIHGLDPAISGLNNPVKVVEHRGIMDAPSGNITITATDRVYLESGSRMDVSGRWAICAADENVIETQFNSVEMKDDYGQKEGLLKGAKIKFDAYLGTSIGDVSGALTSEDVTALEQATKGGSISIKGPLNMGQGLEEIVVKKDAYIDFAGGGIRYAPGQADTTTLLSGTKVYDISNAPEWITYDKVMGLQQIYHERYGITENYSGLFTGGANDLRNFEGGRVEGRDAGTLQLMAKRIVLDGSLDGSVLKGLSQTEEAESKEANGRKEPKAGTLQLGVPDTNTDPSTLDYALREVVVQSSVAPLTSSFKPDDSLPGTGADALKSHLSSQTLSAAGLGALKINVNTKFTTEKDTVLSLQPGAELSVTARAIEHRGEIRVPDGKMTLIAQDNSTTGTIPVIGDGRVFLAPQSKLVTTGERIDNFQSVNAGGGLVSTDHLDGGSVSITVQGSPGQGVIVSKDALIDVSGGYLIDEKGSVTGGDAGSLSIALRSDGKGALILDGDLRGHSITGKKGGSLSILAKRISVEPFGPAPVELEVSSPMPAEVVEKFVLGQDRLANTGFTNITLLANYELEVKPGVKLFPSTAKLAQPVSMGQRGGTGSILNNVYGTESVNGSIVAVDPEYMGSSLITLKAGQDDGLSGGNAGKNNNSMLDIGAQALVGVGPNSTITMEAPGIRVAGHVDAPAGTINLTANGPSMDLTLANGAILSAKGYNKPDAKPAIPGYPVGYTPIPAGKINLESSWGRLVLEKGSLVDVSGSEPVKTYAKSSILGMLPLEYTVASEPGSVSLSFINDPVLDGTLDAHARMQGLPWGSLTLSKEDPAVGLVVSSDDIARFQSQGFDALTLQSKKSIGFSGDLNVRLGRSLTLDAPELDAPEVLGFTGRNVSLSAPWVRLINSPEKYASGDNPYDTILKAIAKPGAGNMVLSGDWIDIEGSIVLSGFGQISLSAGQDIRVSDHVYRNTSVTPPAYVWEGKLKAPGDLTLMADRVHPTTLSSFTFNSSGKVTILPGDGPTDTLIDSAGGMLSIEAKNIEHRGYIAAPMGQISLKADERILLSEGSVLTTVGSTLVKYGDLNGGFWQVQDKASTDLTVTKEVAKIPAKTVDVDGAEVIAMKGAEVNVSGGGDIFTYQFLSSAAGSDNPLEKAGVYVVLPGNPIKRPDATVVFLEGAPGLPAGTYTLLPEQYAFLSGAIILTDLNQAGQSYSMGQGITTEGYPTVKGYSTIPGTDVRSIIPNGYSFRSAKDVLAQGYFDTRTLAAGDAGAVTITGDTTILEGAIRMKALPGFNMGAITLAGQDVKVGESAGSALPAAFDFATPIPKDMKNILNVSPDLFRDMDLDEITIGDSARTKTIVVYGGATIEAHRVTLSAQNEITLLSEAQIHAVSDDGRGVASLLVPTGKLTLQPRSVVHASDEVSLGLKDWDIQGDILVDHSTLTLEGTSIFLVADDYKRAPGEEGLFLTQKQWNQFSMFENIGLKSQGNLLFETNFNLKAAESLTIDSSRIASTGSWNVELDAPTISFFNTGTASAAADTASDTGTLTLTASKISIGHGSLLFDGFSTLNLNSKGDVVFKGAGTLNTGGAGLNISAPRVTTSYYQDDKTTYEVANFKIEAWGTVRVDPNDNTKTITGTFYTPVTMTKGTGTAGQSVVPGGTLEVNALTIDIANLVEVSSGRIKMTANGTGPAGSDLAGVGIFLRNGAELNARGSDYAPGGMANLSAASGKVVLATDSKIDVSAGAQGDAGSVSLYAPTGGVLLNGTLEGHASEDKDGNLGLGGSFSLYTNKESDVGSFAALNQKLTDGGFDREIDLRFRSENVAIASGTEVKADRLKVVADGGNLTLNGTVRASGQDARVELYAWNDLTVAGTGKIYAITEEGRGGEVYLNAGHVGSWDTSTPKKGTGVGTLTILSGGLIDVDGDASGKGGKTYFRAYRNGAAANMNLNGTVKGASEILAETVQAYKPTGSNIGSSSSYITSPATVDSSHLTVLAGNHGSQAQLKTLSGIEIQKDGDLTLDQAWDFTTPSNQLPGVLTLRAAGNLNLNANLRDRWSTYSPVQDGKQDTWAFNLISGADLTSSDLLAVGNASGKLTIVDGKTVYTESAPIRVASGGDMEVRSGQILPADLINKKYWWANELPISLGTYDGRLQGRVGGNLLVNNGNIVSGTGDIEMRVGKDLVLGTGTEGSILTIGRTTSTTQYYRYRRLDAGDIRLDVGGDVRFNGAWDQSAAWDFNYSARGSSSYDWAPSFKNQQAGSSGTKPTRNIRGIAALGDGNVEMHTGGSFKAPAGTFGYVVRTTMEQSGTGNLRLYAGGDVLGRFLVMKGDAEIHALGSLVKYNLAGTVAGTVLEGFDARFNVSGQGDVHLGTILNPTLVGGDKLLLYSNGALASITSELGDVVFYGNSPYMNATGTLESTLAPTLDIEAAGDIRFLSSLTLSPSPTGNLRLIAGENIDGYVPDSSTLDRYSITVSDVAGAFSKSNPSIAIASQDLIHEQDTCPIEIRAGGDIRGLLFYLPKKAAITAGGDLYDIYLSGQNLSPEDLTMVRAGKDIVLPERGTLAGSYYSGVEVAGPGTVLVQAGDSISLGDARIGIRTIGGTMNPKLSSQGSALIVAAGFDQDLQAEEIPGFFEGLRDAIHQYTSLLEAGKKDEAEAVVKKTRVDMISPILAGTPTAGEGNIMMLNSQISTISGQDPLFILSRGRIDVGRTTFFKSDDDRANTGIFTAAGGSIDILSVGDVNVNESRVMTFMGGDITIWADDGMINAGRGSKTTVSANPPKKDSSGRVFFSPPSVGSGIRTLTFDPDGEAGPLKAPDAGDIYLFAKVIDAGEAGIAGKNLFLGSTTVLNAQNISFSGTGLGVPTSSQGAANIGALSGTGALADASKMSEQTTNLASQKADSAREAAKQVEEFMAQWVDVRVLSFYEIESGLSQ